MEEQGEIPSPTVWAPQSSLNVGDQYRSASCPPPASSSEILYGTCHLMRREGVSGKLIAKLQGIARDSDTRRPYREYDHAALFRATDGGQLRLIDKYTRKGGDPNWPARHRGATALMLAVSSGDVATCRVLLSGGGDPNARFKNLSAISVAAIEGQARLMEVLIEAGGDPWLTDVFNQNALHLAASAGQGLVVEHLLTHSAWGANLNVKDSSSCTALQLAIQNNHHTVALMLMRAGATADIHVDAKLITARAEVQQVKNRLSTAPLRQSSRIGPPQSPIPPQLLDPSAMSRRAPSAQLIS